MTTADPEARRPARPLSPHLSIYRPIITMVMSILHRITGVMNVGGFILVVAYLMALAIGPGAYEFMSGVYSSILGRVVLVAFTWSVIHHMLGGVRHAIWDVGRAMGEERYTLAWGTLVGSIALTGSLWVIVIVVENV